MSCMGGWCAKREKCPNNKPDQTVPAERLCIKGADGVRLVQATLARVLHVDVFTGRQVKVEMVAA